MDARLRRHRRRCTTARGFSPRAQSARAGDITTVRFRWRDLNGDRFVQRNELDLQRLLFFSGNYDPNNPTSTSTTTTVDPGFDNDRTSEVLAAVDHELLPNMAVGATYIWRRYDRFEWSPRVGLSNRDYRAVTRSFACGNTTCDEPSYLVTYYELPFTIPATVRPQQSGFSSHSSWLGVHGAAPLRRSMDDEWQHWIE